MSRSRFVLTPVAVVAIALLHPAARAQAPEAPAQLRASPMLRDAIPSAEKDQLPTFVSGEKIQGRTDVETVVEGQAELRRGNMMIRADRLEYNQPKDLAKATGNVRINKAGDIFEGPYLEMEVDAYTGFFNQPRYRFLRNNAYGEADRVEFLDENRTIVRNATYTTCQRKPGPSWMPDWILRAANLSLDTERDIGVAINSVLEFKGVPILPLPAMSFPLSDTRKSGVLPPTFGVDNLSGIKATVPYYWNIAPNRDATLYPTLMSKRGVDLGGEFRYLEPEYSGTVRGNYMPSDRLRGRDRWGYTVRHDGVVHLPGVDPMSLSLNLNRVSDDNYWRDFYHSGSIQTLMQRLLVNDSMLGWGRGDFSVFGRVMTWQTLQEPNIITPPYDRAPQFVGRWANNRLPGGFEASVDADYTRFVSIPRMTGQPNARRAFLLGQVTRPWQAPGWFVIPKAQLHARTYSFDTPTAAGQTSARVTVPTLSVDSGLVFERDAAFFGTSVRQTLEPRAFYVYTPFRDQNNLPVYDTGQNDFNFASIWREHIFEGSDRIADNNLLTLGLTSRFLDQEDGRELARFGVAQRLRFKDQRVTLPGGAPVSERLSDLLLGATLNWSPQWSASGTFQYNPKTNQSVRSTFGASYHPAPYRVVSAAYRHQRAQRSEQLDVSWQWPLNDLWGDRGTSLGKGMGEGEGRWYTVGRLNFSLRERRLVDAIVGLEYDAGCWIGRVVFERLQAGNATANKSILFQLEFIGFSRLGANSLQTLKDNIPRYQMLRQETRSPSRFTNYD